jgi:hypothetical protein
MRKLTRILSDREREIGNVETFPEFMKSCKDGSFSEWDCSAYWIGEWNNLDMISLKSINFETDERPEWATKIYWASK